MSTIYIQTDRWRIAVTTFIPVMHRIKSDISSIRNQIKDSFDGE